MEIECPACGAEIDIDEDTWTGFECVRCGEYFDGDELEDEDLDEND